MITLQLCMYTRKIVLKFIVDSLLRSHLRNVSSCFRVKNTDEILENHSKWTGNLKFGILEFSSKVNNITTY